MIGLWSRLKSGLSKSADSLKELVRDVIVRKRLDSATLEQLEDALIMSDLGVTTAHDLIAALKRDKFEQDVTDEDVRLHLANNLATSLSICQKPLLMAEQGPTIILMVGVNGSGKTTTIAKLAHLYQQQGRSILLAAADTFRAGAVAQLDEWAKRLNIPLMTANTTDPAAVAFAATQRALTEKFDILLIDTAGRLHNRGELMDQLAKVYRVIQKACPSAPHHTLLVLDGTTGQNMVQQTQVFRSVANVSGLIITKLDGTAKAGALVQLTQQPQPLPIHYIGLGEAMDDLKPFVAIDFATHLLNVSSSSGDQSAA